MSRRSSFRFASGTFIHTTGSEGSRHDPYSWEEYTVIKGDDTITLRDGSIGYCTLTRNGKEIDRDADGILNDDSKACIFRQLTGFRPDQWIRFEQKARSRCACGCRKTHYEDGFPGESLIVCDRCGNVVGCDFNESAIM